MTGDDQGDGEAAVEPDSEELRLFAVALSRRAAALEAAGESHDPDELLSCVSCLSSAALGLEVLGAPGGREVARAAYLAFRSASSPAQRRELERWLGAGP